MPQSGLASIGRNWHRRLDTVSGAILLFTAAFAPWGAGGTLKWSSWTLIGAGWTLGLLLLAKRLLERFTGYRPVRWQGDAPAAAWPVRAMAVLTGLVLLQVLVSLWNVRAEVNWTSRGVEFLYRDSYIPWLPTTYDLAATRKALFRYLAFAAAFWAMRDWLQIKSRSERHREEDGRDADDIGRVPDRIRWLGWTLAISSAAMALVGILHRLDHAKDLLWLVKLPQMNNEAMFGSFPYRANAAQFLNLVWPCTLGLWWALRHQAQRPQEKPTRAGGKAHPLLLLSVALMVSAVFVAGSRGGIAVATALVLLVLVVLGRSMKGVGPRVALAAALGVGLALAWGLSSKFLTKRFENSLTDETLAGRTEIFEIARRIASDFPVWGSGAETFLTINGLYRQNDSAKWHGYVHDDWLETRATLGIVGFVVVVALVLMIPAARRWCGRTPVVAEFSWLLGAALVGALAHARFDFPFQIPSIHLEFLLLAALFTVIGRLPSRARR